jgi:type II secretory ATPase GspE/PulE/Tfp pilus assembly ATPase PilB-like protein
MAKRLKLGELLVGSGAITEHQLRAALLEQRKWSKPLGMTLVAMGYLDEEALVRTLARQLGLQIAWLHGKRIAPEVMEMIPAELAAKHRCLPVAVREEEGGRVLYLGMQDPADLEAIDDVSFRAGCRVKAVLVAPSELEEALRQQYQYASDEQTSPAPEAEAGKGPDFLTLTGEVQFAPCAEDVPLEFVRDTEQPGSDSDAALKRLAQLVSALVDAGVFRLDDVIERLRQLSRQ